MLCLLFFMKKGLKICLAKNECNVKKNIKYLLKDLNNSSFNEKIGQFMVNNLSFIEKTFQGTGWIKFMC